MFGDPYFTGTELQARLGIDTPTSAETTRLSSACSAASQDIEVFCRRQFNRGLDGPSTRTYHAEGSHLLLVDDFFTTDGLEVRMDGVLLPQSDYSIEPFNGTRSGMTQFPYWLLRSKSPTGWVPNYALTKHRTAEFQVTADWGWSEIPDAIKEAAALLGTEYFKLKEAPFGIANWGEFGPVRVYQNQVVYSVLRLFRRGGMMVA